MFCKNVDQIDGNIGYKFYIDLKSLFMFDHKFIEKIMSIILFRIKSKYFKEIKFLLHTV